ncbi:hypothetical protein BGX38DRAFT_287144 [Terfezia claveryi]|nr:hypothetical protein BGX38DRAFT_287144 [Terfezia claveryi]
MQTIRLSDSKARDDNETTRTSCLANDNSYRDKSRRQNEHLYERNTDKTKISRKRRNDDIMRRRRTLVSLWSLQYRQFVGTIVQQRVGCLLYGGYPPPLIIYISPSLASVSSSGISHPTTEVFFNREAAIAFDFTQNGVLSRRIEPPHRIPTIPHEPRTMGCGSNRTIRLLST